MARIARALARFRFKLLGLATIKDIPTDRFNLLVRELLSEGWVVGSQYEGVDAWIDYGKVKLRKGVATLIFEWDNCRRRTGLVGSSVRLIWKELP